MPPRSLALLIFAFAIAATGVSAQTLTSRTYGGSGSDAANGVTTDSAGNLYIAGTTTSFDLPLLNSAQSANSGTQIIFSPDAGLTWKPVGNLPNPYTPYQNGQAIPLAVDPTNPAVFYAAFNGMIFKTTDSGKQFSGVLLQPQVQQIFTIIIDPANPSNVYAATDAGALKSANAGASWANSSSGLPVPTQVDSLAIDPFHSKSLWASVGAAGYVSKDGGNSWSAVILPSPAATGLVAQFVFDLVTPGTLYVNGSESGNGASFLLKSKDGGVTWSELSAPFFNGPLVADPVRAGYLYNVSTGSSAGASTLFYRSTDGGASWQSFPFPSSYAFFIAIDPVNPNIMIVGSYRSTDDGQTWSPITVSRQIQAAFAPTGKGWLFATGPITSDIFLAKFAPGGALEFATYFGGMGNETASGVQVDASGNIWVAGSTNSLDLPVSKNAVQQELKGFSNTFLAEFSAQGKLLASTYLGGSGTDAVAALRLDGKGNPWIYGFTNSADFPLMKGGPPPLQPGAYYVFLAEMASSASEVLYSASIPGANQPGGMAMDASGNILLTGTTYTLGFPVTANVAHGVAPPGPGVEDAFLIKLDSSGNTIFSTYLGGSLPAPTQLGAGLANNGIAVAADSTGIYVAGNTSATDFPTTPGAYQTKLKGGCSYPAFEEDTGLIGTISFYVVDNVFVTKLSPDASKTIYSTLVGGSCYDRPTAIAVTPAGAVFVTGETNSIDFPVVHPFEGAPAIQNYESFVSMLDPSGGKLQFSTYLTAGSEPSLALDPSGILHVAGDTGYGAQSVTFVGFLFGPINPMTKAYLAGLNVSAAPAALNLTGALNAFSLLPGPIAPGEIVQLSVPDFKPAHDLNVGLNEVLPLGTSLGGTEVLFDGKAVPVIGIFDGRIVCIAPQDFGTEQSTVIQVNASGTLSNSLSAGIAPTALGLLSANGSGQGLANARNHDGTLNSASNPAKRGSTVTVYLTGAGVPPAAIFTNFGSTAHIAPMHGFVPGIYAAEFQVPTDTSYGSPLSVYLQAGGASLVEPGSTSQNLSIYIE